MGSNIKTLNGGLYIVRYNNGNVKKVFIQWENYSNPKKSNSKQK
jgi:hypothetical protein